MRRSDIKGTLNIALIAATILLLGVTMAFGQTATVSGGPLTFGSVEDGATSSPQSVTLTVTNTGSTTLDPIGISNLSFSTSVFSEPTTDTPINNCAGAGGVVAGGSCTITLNVVFQPNSIGTVNGTLTLVNVTASSSPVAVTGAVAITATGYDAVTVTGSPTNFGTLPVNVTSTSQTVTLTVNNSGSATVDPITSSNLSFSSALFSAVGAPAGTCTTGVAGNGSCTLTLGVAFTPAAVGNVDGSLTLVNLTSGGLPVTSTGSVGLNGTGYEPSVTIQLMGEVVTVSNQSSTPISFAQPTLSNTVFSIVTGSGAGTCPVSGAITLAASSCTINIGSGSPSTESAQLTITATATDPGTTTVVNVPVIGSPATIGEASPPGSGTGSTGDNGLEQVVTLTAAPTSLMLPDGSTVPMWGYSCGAAVTASGATCSKLNPGAAGWSPVVITVPSGQHDPEHGAYVDDDRGPGGRRPRFARTTDYDAKSGPL
jgi:hypothetical protein